MIKQFGILTFSLLIGTTLSFAQPTSTSTNKQHLKVQTNIQQSFEISSRYAKHDYLIQISVPTGEAPSEGFPVLYVLDGNATFDSAANIAKSIGSAANRLGLSPVAIVAIGYPKQSTFDVEKRALDYTPEASTEFQKQAKYSYGGADQFIQFIEKELKPAIQTKIKVNPQQQSLFGHSFGGLFVLHTVMTHPETFQRYIAASPSLWFDNYALLNRQVDWLNNKVNKVQNTMLMTTVGTHEHGRSPTPYAESLQKQNNFYQDFNQQRSKHFLFWNYRHPAEQHLTNLYASLPKAIMLAGCIDHKSCSALFDKPVTP